MLFIELVADAIDHGVGNKAVADLLRMKQSAEVFLDVPGTLARIEECVLDDREFARFCTALGLPPTVRLQLLHDRTSRGYMALRHWMQLSTRSAADLCAILAEFSPALGERLKITPARSIVPTPFVAQSLDMVTDEPDATNPLARGFQASNRVVTAGEFIRDTENTFLQKICAAFNEHDQYGQLLALFGVQPSIESSRRLAELRERWLKGRFTGRRGNPSLAILTDLCGSAEFAAQPLSALADTLMKCAAAPARLPVTEWIVAMADQKKAADGTLRAAVDQHDELRAFFLEKKLATSELEAQQFIDRLTTREIDVHTLAQLRQLDKNDLRDAGFSMRLSKEIASAL